MKTYKIHLIRHGQTEANAKGLYIGMTDLPLSPEGLAELLTLKREYTYPAPLVFSPAPDPLQANLGGAISRLPAGSGGRAGGMRFRGLGRPQRGGTAKRSAFSTLDGRRQRGQNSRRRECRRLSKAGDGGLRRAGAGIDAFGGYRSGGLHPRRRDHAADDGLRSSQAGNERLLWRKAATASRCASRLPSGCGSRWPRRCA